jgi:hypothetical protein
LKSQVYPWGNTSANAQNSNWVIFTGYPNNTTPVGTYPRNGFGLSDCAGNILEITWDTTLAPADEVPTELKNYVVRGGGWQQGYQPKITFGHAGRPFWDSSDAFGFRLARTRYLMTFSELIAANPDYATAKDLAIIITPRQAQIFADTQNAYGDPRHVPLPVALSDGTLFLCADLLTEFGPNGLYRSWFQHLPQDLFPQIYIIPMSEAIALIPALEQID